MSNNNIINEQEQMDTKSKRIERLITKNEAELNEQINKYKELLKEYEQAKKEKQKRKKEQDIKSLYNFVTKYYGTSDIEQIKEYITSGFRPSDSTEEIHFDDENIISVEDTNPPEMDPFA